VSGAGCGSGRRTAPRALAGALALLAAGCAAMPGTTPPAAPKAAPGAPTPAAVSAAPAVVAPAPPATALPSFPDPISAPWITARIAELEAARKKGGADPDGALALELALLYSHPANPSPDHIRALAMMRGYLALAPPGTRDPLVLHIAGLLEDIDQLGKVAREARAREKELAAQAQALERRVAEAGQRDAAAKKREQELLGQMKTLQQQIEQLQKLDLEMEKRRRSVR